MGNVTIERAAVDIDGQLARYRELAEERRALLGRMEKAKSQKQSVRENIFQKVYDGYESTLRDLEDELEPLAKGIEEACAALRDEMRDVETRSEELQDTIDELSFRHRVGEFDETAWNERRAPLEGEHERLAQRHSELSETLARITSRETPRQRTEPVAPPPRRAEPEPQRAETVLQPTETAGQPAPPATENAFVDPTDWVDEFVSEDPPADRATDGPQPLGSPSAVQGSSAAAEDFDEDASRDVKFAAADCAEAKCAHDRLCELADPDDESCEEPHTHRERRHPASGARPAGLPILTITKGPGAGKSLPLLPMTMTVGREVDNNVEIRDMNVARYHARISFEAGKYVIQDIEGSPGTFVDGQRITKVALAPGAVIRVGGTELKFCLD